MRVAAALLLAAAAGAQETPLESGEKKLEAGDYAGAVADFTRAIEGGQGDARAYAGRGRALQLLDRDEEAIRDLTMAVNFARKLDPVVLVRRATSYWILGDNDAAIGDCGAAIELAPDSAGAYRIRGEALLKKREGAAALRDFDKALVLDPRYRAALRSRGRTKRGLRDFVGAVEDFTRLAQLDPMSPVPFAQRGRTRMCLEDYRGAIEDFEAAFSNEDASDPDRSLHVICARAHLALGHKEESEAELAKAAEPPEDAEAFEDRGRLYYDTGRLKEAVADFSRAVALEPQDQDYTRLFLFLSRAALGERPLAAGELKTFLNRRARHDDWYGKLGRFLCGSLEEAELLEAAGSGNQQVALEQECEACFYAGAKRRLDGDATGARALFERCIATDLRVFIEHTSARMALAAME